MSASNPAPWGSSFRLVAAEKWKAKSAALGNAVTEAIVEYSRPFPDMLVLDLASGTGEPGISLAQRVGPQGSVTAVDQSSDLLDIAAGRARNKKLSNFTTQLADAHQLPFADQSFDLATCRFGVMFFSDAPRALAELRRVLKPGARACFAAWGPMEQPYWQTTMKIVHRHVGGTKPCFNLEDPILFDSRPRALSPRCSAPRDFTRCRSRLKIFPGPGRETRKKFSNTPAPWQLRSGRCWNGFGRKSGR